MTGSLHERAARIEKAASLADVLHAADVSADVAERLDELQWMQLAAIAEVKPPGAETRALAIASLRRREKFAGQFAAIGH